MAITEHKGPMLIAESEMLDSGFVVSLRMPVLHMPQVLASPVSHCCMHALLSNHGVSSFHLELSFLFFNIVRDSIEEVKMT